VRSLHFGSHWIQGSMRIARPYALELEYTRDMMIALLLRAGARWPRQVLMIGLGTASLAKFLYRHRPRAKLDVVEIEPAVVACARQFFHLPDDPRRLTVAIGDGAEYLAGTDRRFDLILVDGFDAAGRAGPLDGLPFYCAAAAASSDEGLVVTNLLSRRDSVAPSLERLRAAFAGRVTALPRSEAGNTVAVAAAGEPIDLSLVQLRVRARALRAATRLNLLPTLARLAPALGGEATALRL
jgi:spermidine synthase